MNRADFDALVESTKKATADLLISKGAEYAGDGDRLADFKRNAIKNGQTVLGTWGVYWGKHVNSIYTYMGRCQDRATQLALQEVCEAYYLAKNEPPTRTSLPPSVRLRQIVDPEAFRLKVAGALPDAMREVESKLSEPIESRFHDNINYSYLVIALLRELRDAGPPSASQSPITSRPEPI